MQRNHPLIVGNWKATPDTLDKALELVAALGVKLQQSSKHVQIHLAAPIIYASVLAEEHERIHIGIQNIHLVSQGQSTGSLSPKMLVSSRISFVMLGHSEVRECGVTSAEVATLTSALAHKNLHIIICVGEKARDHTDIYKKEIAEMLSQSLASVPFDEYERIVIAYEPVWAIGRTEGATARECYEAVTHIRRTLTEIAHIDVAKKVRVLYGGSVTRENARRFIVEGGVDGLLIGRASQDADHFYDIIRACDM